MPLTKVKGSKNGLQKYRVRVNFTTPSGEYKQIERTAYGLQEAKELEQELLCEKNAPSKMTVQELYSEYMSAKKHEVRETSYDKSKRTLEFNVLSLLPNVKIDKLSSPILQKWKDEINKRDVKITTKKNYYKEFSAMLNFAVKREYLSKNPLLLVGNFKDVYFETSEGKMRVYTAEQFKKYINTSLQLTENEDTITSWSYYVFFNIAFFTGMRKGEIHALKWSDLSEDTLNVRRSISQKIKGAEITETPPKNKSSYRSLKLPKQLIEILEAHRARQEDFFSENIDDFRICGGDKCLRDTSIDKYNRKICEIAELPRITIHEFRHTHASLLIAQKINVLEISRRLGHANPTITLNVYAHLFPNEEQKAIEFLENL